MQAHLCNRLQCYFGLAQCRSGLLHLAQLTFMVNNGPKLRLLSSAQCQITVSSKGRSLIVNGPVYCINAVKLLLPTYAIHVVNEQAMADMGGSFLPELQDEELIPFITELTANDRTGSERCSTSVGRTVDCDGYAIPWNRLTQKRWTNGSWIYLKFGYVDNISKVIVISVHPSTSHPKI